MVLSYGFHETAQRIKNQESHQEESWVCAKKAGAPAQCQSALCNLEVQKAMQMPSYSWVNS